jgi:hypothetical protein
MPTTGNWPRWMSASGILFGILFIVGVLMVNLPDGSNESVTSFYTESGNRLQIILAAYILCAAAVLFVVYLLDLRARMSAAGSAGSVWLQLSFVTGVVFAVTVVMLAASIASIAASISIGGDPQPTADVARFVPEIGYGFLMVGGALMVAVHLASTAAEAMRNGLLPKWQSWLGYAFAIIVLAAALFIPLIAVPLWTIITGIVLLRGKSQPTVAGAPAVA